MLYSKYTIVFLHSIKYLQNRGTQMCLHFFKVQLSCTFRPSNCTYFHTYHIYTHTECTYTKKRCTCICAFWHTYCTLDLQNAPTVSFEPLIVPCTKSLVHSGPPKGAGSGSNYFWRFWQSLQFVYFWNLAKTKHLYSPDLQRIRHLLFLNQNQPLMVLKSTAGSRIIWIWSFIYTEQLRGNLFYHPIFITSWK